MFPQGLALLPLVITALISFSVVHRAARLGAARRSGLGAGNRSRSAAARHTTDPWRAPAIQLPNPAASSSDRADAGWVELAPARSPFETPAFWDKDPDADLQLTADRSAMPLRRTPPAWDPLGAAPFAWDLPEPPPLRQPHTWRRPRGTARLTTGAVLLAAAVAAVGDFAGWWPLSWTAAAATAIFVVAIGLLAGSLRARAHR